MLISRIRKPRGGVILVAITIALLVGGVGAGSASAAEKSDVSSVEAAKKRDALLKMRAEALEDFEHKGLVRAQGETWTAVSASPVRAGQRLKIRKVDGLTLEVEPATPDPGDIR